jgi:hypothetical protein
VTDIDRGLRDELPETSRRRRLDGQLVRVGPEADYDGEIAAVLLNHPARLSTSACLLFPILYGFAALRLGQDIGFDTLNYHFANPYWVLHNHFFDLQPSQWQTYLDPIFNIPTYLLQSSLSARSASFIIAGIQGLAFIPLYLLGKQIIAQRFLALVLATLGMFGAIAWSEIGTSFGDNFVAIFFLISVTLVGRVAITTALRRSSGCSIAASGLLAGIAVGLKLSEAPIAVGFLVAIPVLLIPGFSRVGSTLRYAAGLLLGFLATYGYWGFELTTRFGNPFLPFFNNVFHSKFAPAAANLDGQSVAKGFVQWLFYPFLWAFNSHLVSVISFRELSLPICELLVWVALALRVYSCARRRVWVPMFANQFERFLVVGSCASVLIWARTIGLYRYITSIEMIGFVLIWVLLASVCRGLYPIPFPARLFRLSLAAICAICVLTERPANWGRSPFAGRFFTVSVPKQFRRPGVTLLMLTDNPYTYILPFLPAGTDAIRIQGSVPTPYVNNLIIGRLKRASAIYVTWTEEQLQPFIAANASSWSRYHLQLINGSCSVFSTFAGSKRMWVHYCQVAPLNTGTRSPGNAPST